MKWGVVVAAGGLVTEPLATAIGSPRKALARIGNKSILAHTLDAVRGIPCEECVTVSGPDVASDVTFGKLIEESSSQMENVRRGLMALPPVDAVLFLPSDSPFLTTSALIDFQAQVAARVAEGVAARWFTAGLCAERETQRLYPEMPTEALHFREGRLMSGALYAASPEGFFHALNLLHQASDSRKNQLKLAIKLGPVLMLRYFMRRLNLADAAQRVSDVLGGTAFPILEVDPATVLDIDTVEDLQACLAIARRTLGSTSFT